MPREGHLEAALHVIGCMKLKYNSWLMLNTAYPDIIVIIGNEIGQIFMTVKQKLSHPMFCCLKAEVDLCMFGHNNHATNKQTRRSRTGFMMYTDMSLINWNSKWQVTIDSSASGTEFVAMKVIVGTLHAIQCTMRMMGITITGIMYMYGDIMSIIHKASKPEFIIKEKCNAITYHAVHKCVAMRWSLTGHIRKKDDPAHLLTNAITGQKEVPHVASVTQQLWLGYLTIEEQNIMS